MLRKLKHRVLLKGALLLCGFVDLHVVDAFAAPNKRDFILSDSLHTSLKPNEGFFVFRCNQNEVYRLTASLSYTKVESDNHLVSDFSDTAKIVSLASVIPTRIKECDPVWYVPVLFLEELTYISTAPRQWTKALGDFATMSIPELTQVVRSQKDLLEKVKEEVSAEELKLKASKQKRASSVALEYLSSPVFRVANTEWNSRVVRKHVELLRERFSSEGTQPVSPQQKVVLTNQLGELAAAAKQAEERVSSKKLSESQAELIMRGRTVDIAVLETKLARLQARWRALTEGRENSRPSRSTTEDYLFQ
jgi:hypothetical protein